MKCFVRRKHPKGPLALLFNRQMFFSTGPWKSGHPLDFLYKNTSNQRRLYIKWFLWYAYMPTFDNKYSCTITDTVAQVLKTIHTNLTNPAVTQPMQITPLHSNGRFWALTFWQMASWIWIILSGGKIELAGGKIILAGGKINLAGRKWLPHQAEHPKKSKHLKGCSGPRVGWL